MLDPEKLKYHRELCHDVDSNEFICPECIKNLGEKITGVWAKVAMHLWREHQIDMELLTCPQCPQFRSFNRNRRDDHMSKHMDQRPHQCLKCNKSFKLERHLKDHLVRFHGKQRHYENDPLIDKFPCQHCDKIFKVKTSLVNHVKIVHEGLKPFTCHFCPYSASSKSNLVIHERQHTGEKPYSCSYCEYRCADKTSLNKHSLRHTGVKRFFCKLCKFGTIQAANLGYHYNAVHCDQAVQMKLLFKCDFCKYFTINEECYKAHLIKMHDDDVNVT